MVLGFGKKRTIFVFRSHKYASIVTGNEIDSTSFNTLIEYIFKPRKIWEYLPFLGASKASGTYPNELISEVLPMYENGKVIPRNVVIVNMDLLGNKYTVDLPPKIIESINSLKNENLAIKRENYTLRTQLKDAEGEDRIKDKMLREAKQYGEIRKAMSPYSEQGGFSDIERRWRGLPLE